MFDKKLKYKLTRNNRPKNQNYLSQKEFDYLVKNDIYRQEKNQLFITNSDEYPRLPYHMIFVATKLYVKIIKAYFHNRTLTFSESDSFFVNYKQNSNIKSISFVKEYENTKLIELNSNSFYLLIDKNEKNTHQKVAVSPEIFVDLFLKDKTIIDINYSPRIQHFVHSQLQKDEKDFFHYATDKEKTLFSMNFNIPDKALRFFIK